MTRNKLKSYLIDKQKIADLENKKRRLQSNCVMDIVRGSMSDFPYTAHTVSVCGLGDEDLYEVSKCDKDINQLKSNCAEVETWVASLDDPLTQRIIQLMYMERLGTTFQQVAMKIGGNNTKDSVKQRVYRELAKTRSFCSF